MDFWTAIVVIALVGIVAEVIKTGLKRGDQGNPMKKGELNDMRDAISKMQIDIDDIKADLSTMVIQLDDIKRQD